MISRVLLAAAVAAAPLAVDTDYIRNHAHALGGLSRLPDALTNELAPYRAILLGEVHGTREAPQLALQFARLEVQNGHAAWLGLEIPATEQPALERFRASGDVSILKDMPFFKRASKHQDGRSSRALAEMLQQVQKQPEIGTYCIDPGVAATAQERDTAMAFEVARLLKEHPGSVAVALVGGVHASMQPGSAWDPSFRPMGYELTHGAGLPASQALAIQLCCQQGTAWNMVSLPGGAYTTGIRPVTPVDALYANAVLWGAYFLKLPAVMNGFGAVLFYRTLTASPPFDMFTDPAATPPASPHPVTK